MARKVERRRFVTDGSTVTSVPEHMTTPENIKKYYGGKWCETKDVALISIFFDVDTEKLQKAFDKEAEVKAKKTEKKEAKEEIKESSSKED